MSNTAALPTGRQPVWVIVVSLLVGQGVGGLAIAALGPPPQAPGVPSWVFPAVWTVLFPCFGLATSAVLNTGSAGGSRALRWGAVTAAVILAWVPIASATGEPWAPVVLDLVAWCTVWTTTLAYRQVSRAASRWMFPVALWMPITTVISVVAATVS